MRNFTCIKYILTTVRTDTRNYAYLKPGHVDVKVENRILLINFIKINTHLSFFGCFYFPSTLYGI